MWGDDSSDESSSDDEVPAIGYTAAYFLKRFVNFWDNLCWMPCSMLVFAFSGILDAKLLSKENVTINP